jgi:hypothetical protein
MGTKDLWVGVRGRESQDRVAVSDMGEDSLGGGG